MGAKDGPAGIRATFPAALGRGEAAATSEVGKQQHEMRPECRAGL